MLRSFLYISILLLAVSAEEVRLEASNGAELQAAIARLNGLPEGTVGRVVLRPGVYDLGPETLRIARPAVLQGSESGDTILQCGFSGGAPGLLITQATSMSKLTFTACTGRDPLRVQLEPVQGAAANSRLVTIDRCTFKGNRGAASGGVAALASKGGAQLDLRITGSTFQGNTATGDPGLSGQDLDYDYDYGLGEEEGRRDRAAMPLWVAVVRDRGARPPIRGRAWW